MNLPLVDISNWKRDDEFSIYPYGARDKLLVISPAGSSPIIKGNFRYLFKKSNKRYPWQFWNEVIAYHIGMLIGVNVPKAFPAINSSGNECGALIEWFLDMPSILVHGGDLMKNINEAYDMQKGKQHNFEDIISICKALQLVNMLTKDWEKYWVKVLCFDAIIGNTDRHHNNWGLIFRKGNHEIMFSPAFDNGTALGYEILDKNLSKFDDLSYMDHYINKGQHHMKWDKKKDMSMVRGEIHLDMLKLLCHFFPNGKKWMLEIIPNEDILHQLDVLLNNYRDYKITVPLTIERQNFVMKLLRRRTELISILLAKL